MPALKVVSHDLLIHVPSNSPISLTNSPYPPHVLGSAVDVYVDEALMPCLKGRVARILKIPTPRNRPDSEPFDYCVIIELGGGLCLKVLHVRPEVRVGDELRLGDFMGEVIKSGYLMPWSDPHMHVEVRECSDPLRALGSKPLRPTEELLRHLRMLKECNDLRLKIIKRFKTHYLCEPVGCDALVIKCNDLKAVLDAGIPHYYVGGAVIIEGSCGSCVNASLSNYIVGECIKCLESESRIIIRPSVTFKVNKSPVGVGTYLSGRIVKLVLLGEDPGLRIGEVVKVNVIKTGNLPLPRWLSTRLR